MREGCIGKTRYPSDEMAQSGLAYLAEREPKRRAKLLNTYHCACGYWHVGHRRSRDSRTRHDDGRRATRGPLDRT